MTSPKETKYLLKLELAYVPLFCYMPFGADCLTRECICLGHGQFWYTNSTDYYLESVVDFYDLIKIDKAMSAITVVYGNTRHTITIELMTMAMNVHCGYTVGQFLKDHDPCLIGNMRLYQEARYMMGM